MKINELVGVCCHACADIDQLLNYIIDSRKHFPISCFSMFKYILVEEKKNNKIEKLSIKPNAPNCDQ